MLKGVDPNFITAFAYPLGLIAAYFIAMHNYLWGALMLLLSSFYRVGFAKARAEMIHPLGNIGWPAVGERVERLLVPFLSLLTAAYMPSIFGYDTLSTGLYLFILLSLTGLIQRFFFAKGLLEKNKH